MTVFRFDREVADKHLVNDATVLSDLAYTDDLALFDRLRVYLVYSLPDLLDLLCHEIQQIHQERLILHEQLATITQHMVEA